MFAVIKPPHRGSHSLPTGDHTVSPQGTTQSPHRGPHSLPTRRHIPHCLWPWPRDLLWPMAYEWDMHQSRELYQPQPSSLQASSRSLVPSSLPWNYHVPVSAVPSEWGDWERDSTADSRHWHNLTWKLMPVATLRCGELFITTVELTSMYM
jgi:hypothetical protein